MDDEDPSTEPIGDPVREPTAEQPADEADLGDGVARHEADSASEADAASEAHSPSEAHSLWEAHSPSEVGEALDEHPGEHNEDSKGAEGNEDADGTGLGEDTEDSQDAGDIVDAEVREDADTAARTARDQPDTDDDSPQSSEAPSPVRKPEPALRILRQPQMDAPAATEDVEDADTAAIPAYVEYSPSEMRDYVIGGVLAVASIAAVLALFLAFRSPALGSLLLVALLAAVAAGAWWALSEWNPAVVSVREGVLTVTSDESEEQFDLRDPRTAVDLGPNPKAPTWKATVSRPDGRTAVIRAQQVQARHFVALVEHHRAHLREADPHH